MISDVPQNLPIDAIVKLVRDVGKAIHSQEKDTKPVLMKEDGSHVTRLDRMANNKIILGLHKLTPTIPVIGEERSKEVNKYIQRKGALRWCTDALDGTKRLLELDPNQKEYHQYYSVQLGLVNEKGEPVWGCAYWPALQPPETYFVGKDGKAYLQKGDETPVEINIKEPTAGKTLSAATARSKVIGALKKHGVTPVYEKDSTQHRIARFARGDVDFATVTQGSTLWDSAGMHAIVRAAGGDYFDEQGNPIRYNQGFNQDPLLLPPHFACNPKAKDLILQANPFTDIFKARGGEKRGGKLR